LYEELAGRLQPGEQAILDDTAPLHLNAWAWPLPSMGGGGAGAIGPTLGGWITDNYSWRWIETVREILF
jgi:MFS family permease